VKKEPVRKQRSGFRIVPDTNIVLASERSSSLQSPNREVFERWIQGECTILVSPDTLAEYAEKLIAQGISRERIIEFLGLLTFAAEQITITHFHLPLYPSDPDDIAFLLCAANGNASHLLSYDRHLLGIASAYSFQICTPIAMLKSLRASQQ
jgi:uncharacterized protein